MGNAWSSYLCPLGIAVVFFLGGLSVLRSYARGTFGPKGMNATLIAAFFGTLLALIGSTVALAILFASPTPWQRQQMFDRVFRTPPDRIVRFVIKPTQFTPLTQSEVVIDDPARIRQVVESLRNATEVAPNHPLSKWTADVEMITLDGTYHFGVNATVAGDRNGNLVNVSSRPGGYGWNLGDARADGLDRLLEDAVKSAAAD
jgi:hypothetical protein